MLKTLHQLSAFFFFLLGATFFLAFVFFKRSFFGVWPAWWLQVADLPLALTALLYGGISLYESLRGGKHSKQLAIGIGLPFIVFFIVILLMNFWPR